MRGFATYIIPKVDVLISGIFRFQPNSTFGVGATPEGNSTGLVGQLRASPTGQHGQPAAAGTGISPIASIRSTCGSARSSTSAATRTNIAIDVLNLFNANTGTAFQQNYGDGSQYLNPTQILNPRFVRFNVTMDF